jgi:hypothetical protein
LTAERLEKSPALGWQVKPQNERSKAGMNYVDRKPSDFRVLKAFRSGNTRRHVKKQE